MKLTPAQRALVNSPGARELVRWVVRRYVRRYPATGADEVRALADEALVLAARRFDPDRGVPFAGYAAKRVTGHLTRQLGAERYRGFPALLSMVENAMVEKHAATTSPLDAADQTPAEARAFAASWVADRAAHYAVAVALGPKKPSSPEDDVNDRQLWHNAIAALEHAERDLAPELRRIVGRHYRDGLSIEDIADEIGKSRATTYRLHKKALDALRGRLLSQGVAAPPPTLEASPPSS